MTEKRCGTCGSETPDDVRHVCKKHGVVVEPTSGEHVGCSQLPCPDPFHDQPKGETETAGEDRDDAADQLARKILKPVSPDVDWMAAPLEAERCQNAAGLIRAHDRLTRAAAIRKVVARLRDTIDTVDGVETVSEAAYRSGRLADAISRRWTGNYFHEFLDEKETD
jgi:hypothetical protein